MKERSLIVFTLLAQTAVGVWWTASVFFFVLHDPIAEELLAPVLATCVPLIAIALAASLFHLGTPSNAWRAFNNVRSSWLSREILSAVAFGGASLVATAEVWFHTGSQEGRIALIVGTSLLGLALIVSMSNTYRLRTVALWKTWWTPVSFFLTAGLLGLLLNGGLFVVVLDNMPEGQLFVWLTRYDFSPLAIIHLIAVSVVALLIIKLMATRHWLSIDVAALLKQQHRRGFRLYLVLSLIGLGAAASLIPVGERTTLILFTSVAFVSIAGAEIIGRWLFFEARMWLGAWH